MIERYDTFNTKGCPDELIFGDFNDQPIPSDNYNLIKDENDNSNNVSGPPVDDALPENKVLEYIVVPNDKDIVYEIIIIDDDDCLALDIEPYQNEVLEIEGADNEIEGREIGLVDEENEGVDNEVLPYE